MSGLAGSKYIAYFSTDGGKHPPRSASSSDVSTIVRSNPTTDAEQLIRSLRARWPHVCQAIFAPWQIHWFFDEYDFHLQGGRFLYEHVLSRIQKENEVKLVSFCQEWSEFNKKQFHAVTHTPTASLFHDDDHRRYGIGFLEKAREWMCGAYERATQEAVIKLRREQESVNNHGQYKHGKANSHLPTHGMLSRRNEPHPLPSPFPTFVPGRPGFYPAPPPAIGNIMPPNFGGPQTPCMVVPSAGHGNMPFPGYPLLQPISQETALQLKDSSFLGGQYESQAGIPTMMPTDSGFSGVAPNSAFANNGQPSYGDQRQGFVPASPTTPGDDPRSNGRPRRGSFARGRGRGGPPHSGRRSSNSFSNRTDEGPWPTSPVDTKGKRRYSGRRNTVDRHSNAQNSLPTPLEHDERVPAARSAVEYGEEAEKLNRGDSPEMPRIPQTPHSKGPPEFEPRNLEPQYRHAPRVHTSPSEQVTSDFIGPDVNDIYQLYIMRAGQPTIQSVTSRFENIAPVKEVRLGRRLGAYQANLFPNVFVTFYNTNDVRKVLEQTRSWTEFKPVVCRRDISEPSTISLSASVSPTKSQKRQQVFGTNANDEQQQQQSRANDERKQRADSFSIRNNIFSPQDARSSLTVVDEPRTQEKPKQKTWADIASQPKASVPAQPAASIKKQDNEIPGKSNEVNQMRNQPSQSHKVKNVEAIAVTNESENHKPQGEKPQESVKMQQTTTEPQVPKAPAHKAVPQGKSKPNSTKVQDNTRIQDSLEKTALSVASKGTSNKRQMPVRKPVGSSSSAAEQGVDTQDPTHLKTPLPDMWQGQNHRPSKLILSSLGVPMKIFAPVDTTRYGDEACVKPILVSGHIFKSEITAVTEHNSAKPELSTSKSDGPNDSGLLPQDPAHRSTAVSGVPPEIDHLKERSYAHESLLQNRDAMTEGVHRIASERSPELSHESPKDRDLSYEALSSFRSNTLRTHNDPITPRARESSSSSKGTRRALSATFLSAPEPRSWRAEYEQILALLSNISSGKSNKKEGWQKDAHRIKSALEEAEQQIQDVDEKWAASATKSVKSKLRKKSRQAVDSHRQHYDELVMLLEPVRYESRNQLEIAKSQTYNLKGQDLPKQEVIETLDRRRSHLASDASRSISQKRPLQIYHREGEDLVPQDLRDILRSTGSTVQIIVPESSETSHSWSRDVKQDIGNIRGGCQPGGGAQAEDAAFSKDALAWHNTKVDDANEEDNTLSSKLSVQNNNSETLDADYNANVIDLLPPAEMSTESEDGTCDSQLGLGIHITSESTKTVQAQENADVEEIHDSGQHKESIVFSETDSVSTLKSDTTPTTPQGTWSDPTLTTSSGVANRSGATTQSKVEGADEEKSTKVESENQRPPTSRSQSSVKVALPQQTQQKPRTWASIAASSQHSSSPLLTPPSSTPTRRPSDARSPSHITAKRMGTKRNQSADKARDGKREQHYEIKQEGSKDDWSVPAGEMIWHKGDLHAVKKE